MKDKKDVPMPPSNFEELVRQRAKQQKSNGVDWEERKNWWQVRMRLLLDEVEQWLDPLIKDQTIEFTRLNIPRSEDLLGVYQIASGLIKLGNEKLELQPVGSVIVGGFGRVDAKGPNGTAMLLLCAPDPSIAKDKLRDSAEWFIATPQRPTQLQPLTKDNFEQTFADLFGLDNQPSLHAF
ncbi:MAG: hypothetical protein ACLPWS_10355 [Rhodomicrobium sp.]